MSKLNYHISLQPRGWDLPPYIFNKQGHDHNPLFYPIVTVNASSSSSRKPRAKSDAAELALNHFSLPAPSLSAGCSSGSAGVNTRPSTGGTLQLNQQDAKPTHLSNEAVAASKNDESLEGETKFSFEFFIFLQNHYRFLVLEWRFSIYCYNHFYVRCIINCNL
ncbi:hypothetical protein OIU79_030470 [Salix purpurea]|uniref:DRBM domain-containing protein n=1 Tax=Salix purpurea TaxID=77065 RepID=A0A9Q0V980_SALPP|nr:hypothetical protein OIU79_030470 [Salix purpurea]